MRPGQGLQPEMELGPEGDTVLDRIYVGELTVARAEYVALVVEDLGLPIGRVKVFLPP